MCSHRWLAGCRCPNPVPTQVLLEPQEGLMGSVVEALITADSRWSVRGTVTRSVPGGAGPAGRAEGVHTV